MPASENDRKFRVPLLDCPRHVNRVLDHGSCNDRDSQTDRVFHLIENPADVIGLDRGVDDANLVSRAQQGSGDRQEAERSRGLDA